LILYQIFIFLRFTQFDLRSLDSFYDKPGRGRKSLLKDVNPETIRELVINLPSVAVANAIIKEKLNIHVHNERDCFKFCVNVNCDKIIRKGII
jgi:hypothetical protein